MKLSDKATPDVRMSEKRVLQLYQESRLAQKRLNTLLKFLPDPVFAFTLTNTVEYINPAFERVFGWTLDEIKGKNINFIPDHWRDQAKEGMRQLFKNRSVLDFETQRYTKDGRILDILINASILYDEHEVPMGQVLILRDMTLEKRMAKTNQIMFKISKALHSYQHLGDLVALINREIQKLISVEGAFILLADKTEEQLYFYSAQYRNAESEKKFEKIRFSSEQGVSGRVFKTGEPMIVPDVTKSSLFLRRVDDETDLTTRNLLSVPIKLKDRNIGVVTVVNKAHGEFDATDVELLSMVASTIALPIENTRIHEELRQSYDELKMLNSAKDKVINHLAHELKTPVAVLGAAMKLLSKKLKRAGGEDPSIEIVFLRGQRNLNRILDIQYEVEDLLRKKEFKAYHLLKRLLGACTDELALLLETEKEGPDVIEKVAETIERLFGPSQFQSKKVCLQDYLADRVEALTPEFSHRLCTVNTRIEETRRVYIPIEILDIVTRGLIRNAIEYTPDGGQIDIILKNKGDQPELIVQDYGIGITREKLYLIFENFFTPPESQDYSTKNPYEFNAGGRGFDLLRMKVFSEQYQFEIWIDSFRCRVIPKDSDICPGDIQKCLSCKTANDCLESGGTAVHIQFAGKSLGETS